MYTGQLKSSIFDSMYNSDTDILFPPRVIPSLRNLRGAVWEGLVDGLLDKNSLDPERCAFVLLMIRLCGCISCRADSYRAMRGCTECAKQAVRHSQGSDIDLLDLYMVASQDIEHYLYDEQIDAGKRVVKDGIYD